MSDKGAVRGFIPLIAPEIRGNEWRYVKECLDAGWVSSAGGYVEKFERAVADSVGARFAVATVNGTAALHIALLVAGVEPEDEVLVSSLTFIAPANAVRYTGARPVFVDAEPQFWQMDPQRAADFLEKSCHWSGGVLRDKATGRRVRAVVPVHILGHPVDLDPVIDVARNYRLAVIEDATESLGALYRGRRVGSCGDAGCFSFNGNKIITTGGGGMIVTDNEEWACAAKRLATQAKDDPVEYIHGTVGYNYRLTNIQAAMGVAQMEQLESYVAAKRAIASRYEAALQGLPGIVPMAEAAWAKSAFWMYTVRIDEPTFGMDARSLMRVLGERNIQTRPLWQPIHLSAAHRDLRNARCRVAEKLYREALSLPCSVGLTPEDQSSVVEAIKQAIRMNRYATGIAG